MVHHMTQPDTLSEEEISEDVISEETGETATPPSEEEYEEEVEEEFSIHDIEEFIRATEIWDKLLKGEIKVEALPRVRRVTRVVKRRRRK